MDRVQMQRAMIGICHCSVCAVDDATDEEILRFANKANPSGTSNGWSQVIRTTGAPDSPVKCAGEPGRTHFILVC